MAYGKGKKDGVEKRMVELGHLPLDRHWADLRLAWIAAADAIATAAWPVSVAQPIPSGQDLDAAMLAAQAGQKGKLNSVWAEKARLSAKEAVLEQWKRAQRTLFGKFRNIHQIGDHPLVEGTRRLINLPEEFSIKLNDADVASLKALAASLNFQGTLDLFRRIRQGNVNLSPVQREALLALLASIEQRFGRPTWTGTVGRGATCKSKETTVQLHLDYRCVSGGKVAWESLKRSLTDAINPVVDTGKPAELAILMAPVIARQQPIHLKAVLHKDSVEELVKTAAGDLSFTSVCVEISPRSVVVKGVLAQHPRMLAWSEVQHLLGRDFGYVNTVAHAMVSLDAPLDPAFFERAKEWSKSEAKEYLETHSHDGTAVLEQVLDGRDFMARINRHAQHVDRLRSEIDRLYQRIHRLKGEVNRMRGQQVDALVELDLDASSILLVVDDTEQARGRLARMVTRLGQLLVQVGELKTIRRGVYRKVDGLKKAWFGYVSTQEADLAAKHRAAVVREDLTVVAPEKGAPAYKGRTFNKMINGGSKGQYTRRASAKLRWYGIPELVVPSFWTSSCDVRFGVVDKRQRSGERFRAAVDGVEWHADAHAALVLALYPQLRMLSAEEAAQRNQMLTAHAGTRRNTGSSCDKTKKPQPQTPLRGSLAGE